MGNQSGNGGHHVADKQKGKGKHRCDDLAFCDGGNKQTNRKAGQAKQIISQQHRVAFAHRNGSVAA